MKDKFRTCTTRIIVDFYHLRSQYAERQLESLRRLSSEACTLCDRGDFHEGLLCFCFIKDEIGKVISSSHSPLAVSLSDMLMNTNFCISECMDKILKARGDNYAAD